MVIWRSGWRVILYGCMWLASVHATLHLELTQGATKRIPIAWQPFAVSPAHANSVAFAKQISTVMQKDLQHSGEFHWLGDRAFSEPTDYWLQGRIEGDDQSGVIHLSLWQVANEHAVSDVVSSQPFWQRDVAYTHSDAPRALAHRLSDAVYQAITGVPGVFSTQLAYVLVQPESGRYALQVCDADGQNSREILVSDEPIMSPAWSGDGRQLAYVSFENLHPEVYVQRLATGERRLVARFEGINGAPAFSPKGDRLALVLSKGGSPSLYVMDLTSGDLRQLTRGWSLDTEPHWHPSGQSLLFTSNRGGSPQIYEVALDSGAIKRLTYQGQYNAHPSMDSRGRFLIYLHKDDGVFSIARQVYPDGKPRPVMAMGMNQSPSLAPNGRMVLYTAPYQGKRTLFMVSVSGAVRMRLPTPDGEVQSPAWSPHVA